MVEHNNGIALLFNRLDNKMFQDVVFPKAKGILFMKGRIKFHREDGTIGESPGCGSILVAFGEENAETLRSSNIEGRGNTERLVARNPKLRNLLEDDEYIPSLGQLNLMAHHMDELNKAFAYVSASPLSSARYWSSTEYSKVSAWFVSFSNGGTHSNIEYNSYRVRAVIDF